MHQHTSIHLLTTEDEHEALAFERENRVFFARAVGDRGEDYFASFPQRHAGLVAENEAGTSMLFLVRNEQGRVVGRVNLGDLADGAGTSATGSRRTLEANGFERVTGREPGELVVAGNRRPAVHYTRALSR